MKKSVAITIIAILAVAAIALGVLYVTNNDSKTKLISEQEAQIKSLVDGVNEQAGQIQALTADVDAKADEIETLTADVDAKFGEIETLTADVADKAGRIETLTADVEAKTGEIGTLTEEVAQRDGQIETLNKLVEAKDKEIGALTADVEAKAGQIETLTADVQDKAQQIVALTADAAEKAAQIAAKDSAIAGKDEKIAELETASAELQGRIESLTAEIGEKEEQIRTLSAGQAETPEKPEETAERLVHREDNFSITLPAGIIYDLGLQPNGVWEYTDAPSELDAKDMFMVMKIDLGVDVSVLGDSMIQMMIAAVQAEIDKSEEIKDAYFEPAEVLGRPALNMGFTYAMDSVQAQAFGTIMINGQYAYMFFCATLEKSAEEVKAVMLECIAGITENTEEPAPAEPMPEEPAPEEPVSEEPAPEEPVSEAYPAEDPGLRFGMSRDEIKDLLGEWDEEATITEGYDVVRYKDTIYHGYNSIFALVTTENGLHMWLYGIENEGKAFGDLADAFAKMYDAYEGDTGEIIEVFKAMGLQLTPSQMELAVSFGLADYKLYRVDDTTKAILLTVTYDGVTVVAFAQAA